MKSTAGRYKNKAQGQPLAVAWCNGSKPLNPMSASGEFCFLRRIAWQ